MPQLHPRPTFLRRTLFVPVTLVGVVCGYVVWRWKPVTERNDVAGMIAQWEQQALGHSPSHTNSTFTTRRLILSAALALIAMAAAFIGLVGPYLH